MTVIRPENMEQRLKDAVNLVPENAMQESNQTNHLTYYANKTGERHGSLAVVDGKIMVAVGDQLAEANDVSKYGLKDANKTAAREQEIKALIGVRKLHNQLVDAERANSDTVEADRKELKKAYTNFKASHGSIRKSYALSYFKKVGDPFYAELAALENDDGTPASVMDRSTTRLKRSMENPSIRDAFILARNEAVVPSVADIAKLANKTEKEVKTELLSSGAVFEAPNGDIVPTDIYLSGNVRQKMREAQAALKDGNKVMEHNIAELEKVMPDDIPYFNIEAKLGATWVPEAVYKEYIAHMLGRNSTEGINVVFASGKWSVKLDGRLNGSAEAHTNYGTQNYRFNQLVQAALSNQTVRLYSKGSDGSSHYDSEKTEEVNGKIQKIKDDFSAWLWLSPERRVELEHEYNETMNAWSTPKYDGSFLTFEGMALTLGSGQFNLREHQANAIWRAIVNRRSINAHEVGTGKTFTMGGIAVESRRYGIARKPMLLAHNANSATVANEIRMMYPNARVLYVDNLDAKSRDVKLRQIANDDWDVVVVPHSLIDRFALTEDTLMDMAADDIRALEAEFYEAMQDEGISAEKIDLDNDDDIKKIRSVTAKELAKARKSIIENIKKQSQNATKESAVTFENLGIDMILVDEVHEFKKPPIVTRMKMKGLNTQTSNRSIALQFLTRYIRQQNNGGNVHTFTGTPITNTITEIFHQMRYVMEEEMERANVSDWDGWFGSFATEVQDVELTAAGDYEMVTRLAGFVNVPELRQMVGQYMDTVFADDMPEMQPRKTKSGKTLSDELTELERAELLNGRTEKAKDRPYKKVINESADMTEEQLDQFQILQEYAQEWRDAGGKQRREWMQEGNPRSPIVTEGLASKVSFDARIIDPEMVGQEGKGQDSPNSKASRVVKNVLEIYNSDKNANQVIFSDTGYNKTASRTKTVDGEKETTTTPVFSTIHDIVERLVQGGIPREEIAVVTGSTSKAKRAEIAEAMNASKLRVVIGGTDTLGVGVNMQRNLRAMHHMDAPYMPGDLEQRNGRGHRQGNQWNTVLEYRYMTDRLDGRRWQILAVKQRFINSFMKADNKTRIIEGEAAADEQSDILESFSEAAGDPRILQRVKIQNKLDSLNRKERIYTQGLVDIKRQIKETKGKEAELTKKVEQAHLEEVASLINKQREEFKAEIQGKEYETRKEAADALSDYITNNLRVGDKDLQIGTYAGYPLKIEWRGFADEPAVMIDVKGEVFSGKGLQGVEAHMRNYPKRIEAHKEQLAAAQNTVKNLEDALTQPFSQADDLKRTQKQLTDLEKDLELNPVPPPTWLRQGAPIDSEVYFNKKQFIVTGHRYSKDGWFVVAEDEKGQMLIPYMDAKDNTGMSLYEERDFEAPEVSKPELGDGDKVDGPMFSRSTGKGITKAEAERAANKVLKGKNDSITIVQSYSDLPKEVRQAIEAGGDGDGDFGALHYKGHSYIVADYMGSAAEVEAAVFHEHYAHGGLKKLYGTELGRKLDDLLFRASGTEGIRKLAKKQGIDLGEYERALSANKNMDTQTKRRILMEELLAHSAHATGTLKRKLEEVIGAIRQWLRDNGYANLANLRVSDIAYTLKQAREAAIEATNGQRAQAQAMFSRTNENNKYKGGQKLSKKGRSLDWLIENIDFLSQSQLENVLYAQDSNGDWDGIGTSEALEYLNSFAEEYTALERQTTRSGASVLDISDAMPALDALAQNYYETNYKELPASYKDDVLRIFQEDGLSDFDINSMGENKGVMFSRINRTAEALRTGAERAAGRLDEWANTAPEIPSDWTAEQQSAAGKFDTFRPKQPFTDRLKTMVNLSKDKLAQKIFDQFDPLRKLSIKAYQQAHLSRATEGALEALATKGVPFLKDGAIAVRTDNSGFIGAMTKLGDMGEVRKALMWIAANRADKLMGQGRENLFTQEEIDGMKAFAAGTLPDGRSRAAAYGQVAQELRKYNKAVLDIAEEAGLINPEGRATWEDEFYIPFYRILEDENGKVSDRYSYSDARLVRQQVIRQLKGGQSNLGDPLENIMANWSSLLGASMRNMAANEALTQGQEVGVSAKVDAQEFASGERGDTWTMQNGQRTYWHVADPMVVEALEAMNFNGYQNGLMKAAGKFKRMMTMGVTYSPTFRIRSLIRDTLHSMAVADVGYNPIANAIRGFKMSSQETDLAAQLMAGGGAVRFGSFNEGEGGIYLRKMIEAGINEGQILNTADKLKNFLTKFHRDYQELGDRAETVSRAIAYERAYAKTGSHLEASFAARDIMNYTSMGSAAIIRAMAQVLPFFNARLQGMNKLGRGAAENPKRFMSVVGTIGVASALLFLMNKDDEDYKALPDFVRDTYWAIKVGGNWVYIPKPFEVGSLGTVIERFTELAVAGDDYKAKDLTNTLASIMINQLSMNPVPQIMLPLVETGFNYDMFRQRPIDSMAMERLLPEDRFNANTSSAAIAAGKALKVSPQKLEHIVRGYFGWVGTQALNVSDILGRSLVDRPESAKWDLGKTNNMFIVGDFLKEAGTTPSKYSTRFYDLQREINQIYATANAARKEGDQERYKKLMSDPKMKAHSAIKVATRKMTKLNQKIKAVVSDRNISASEKSDRLQNLYKQREQIAKQIDQLARSKGIS